MLPELEVLEEDISCEEMLVEENSEKESLKDDKEKQEEDVDMSCLEQNCYENNNNQTFEKSTYTNILFIFISISLILADVYFDLKLSVKYYLNDNINYCVITLACMYMPALILTAINIRMYIMDFNQHNKHKSLNFSQIAIFSIIVLIIPMVPIMRQCVAFYYACRSKLADFRGQREKEAKKYCKLMVEENADCGLLGVFDCYLETAPQLVLQLTIMIYFLSQPYKVDFTFIHRCFSIGTSFISLGWSIASYQRSLRILSTMKEGKPELSWPGTFLLFFWYFLIAISRIFSISLVASVFTIHTIAALILHWLGMVVFLFVVGGKQAFCNYNKVLDSLFLVIVGFICIFVQIMLVEVPTLFKHTFFHLILAIENILAITVWNFGVGKDSYKAFNFIIIIFLSFVIGLVCMLVYYIYLHPTIGCRYNVSNQKRFEEILSRLRKKVSFEEPIKKVKIVKVGNELEIVNLENNTQA